MSSNKNDLQLSAVTRWVVFAILFMAIGTVSELFLISHYEDSWQILPIILIVLSLVVFSTTLFSSANWAVNVFRWLLAFCALSGLLGVYFHLNANYEFETELHPTQDWLTSFIESLSGALPALAPGSMIAFALIGYIYILLKHKSHKQ
ncbi:hypothetical protein E1176_11400 [Fulvivirga sp. RKSG066]|uniref:hypothetical protein n=1 Tax=Fulvivirga aurantia TaxID=2529383 RepID=UPI0012BC2D63|nr:hypothetical protein [Fulvivirga aurantia]MTI21626.1 hypothetical protein [Fulvivirga aurantia]